MLDALRELGLSAAEPERQALVARTRASFERSLPRVRQLSTAAEGFILAHALSLHGENVDTTPLEKLARKLPRVTKQTDAWCWSTIHAFNYCTHFVLFRTHYLHRRDARLRGSRAARWLERFWRLTDMRDDVEYASQCLNSLAAVGASLPRPARAEALEAIAHAQGRTGSWPADGRYDRFHVTWCAADALHGARRTSCG